MQIGGFQGHHHSHEHQHDNRHHGHHHHHHRSEGMGGGGQCGGDNDMNPLGQIGQAVGDVLGGVGNMLSGIIGFGC